MSNKSDKMATWPVGKLLFSMGLPAVFSMLIQAMYNVVDTIYISRYSQDALFAIGIVTPMVMVGFSIAMGSAVGISTLVSRRLGERKKEEADEVATTGFVLTFFHVVIVMLLGRFLGIPFIKLFTDRQEIIELSYSYLSICMIVCFGQHFSVLFERLMQAQSNMIIPMFAQLLGAITNIILDPILIFGLGSIPAMGIKGAAIATVAGQILSMIFCAILFNRNEVKLKLKGFKFKAERVKDIYSVGIPTAIMNMVNSVTTVLMNSILVSFSENAVSSLSMYFKLQSFVFMPVFGFSQGALPILAYNYGARNKERYIGTVRYYMTTNALIMLAGTLLFRFGPDLVLSFFTMDEALHAIAVNSLQTICLSFVFSAISIAMGSIFQSFGLGTFSMLQSILRQIGILIPLAYFLSRTGRLELVWYAYPLAEFAVFLLFIPLVIRQYHLHFPSQE